MSSASAVDNNGFGDGLEVPQIQNFFQTVCDQNDGTFEIAISLHKF